MTGDAPHRHIVFTIPEELRDCFRINRKAMDLLFIAARNTICCICNERLYRKAKVNYIMRYAFRPAMAESRIVSFDRSSGSVHWFYDRHEDNVRVDVKDHAHEFIKRLLVHIPDDNFPMIC